MGLKKYELTQQFHFKKLLFLTFFGHPHLLQGVGASDGHQRPGAKLRGGEALVASG
jgi:hypothetical protein